MQLHKPIHKLELVQNSAAQILFQPPFTDHITLWSPLSLSNLPHSKIMYKSSRIHSISSSFQHGLKSILRICSLPLELSTTALSTFNNIATYSLFVFTITIKSVRWHWLPWKASKWNLLLSTFCTNTFSWSWSCVQSRSLSDRGFNLLPLTAG